LGVLLATSIIPVGFAVKKIKTLKEDTTEAVIEIAESPQKVAINYDSRDSQLKLKQ
jgi:hypothetical protein